MEKIDHLFKNKSILSLKKIEDLNLKEEAVVAQLVQLILILSSFVKQMTALIVTGNDECSKNGNGSAVKMATRMQ